MSADPWEFFPPDDASDEEEAATEKVRRNPEDAAIHVVTPGRWRPREPVPEGTKDDEPKAMFFPDEDTGEPTTDEADEGEDTDLEALLERQHYAFEPESEDDAES